jgi:hypothetical protein
VTHCRVMHSECCHFMGKGTRSSSMWFKAYSFGNKAYLCRRMIKEVLHRMFIELGLSALCGSQRKTRLTHSDMGM